MTFKSWSQLARELCDKEISYINNGEAYIAESLYMFKTNHPLIEHRAAKRLGRKRRAGRVHEDLKLYREKNPDEVLLERFRNYRSDRPLPPYLIGEQEKESY